MTIVYCPLPLILLSILNLAMASSTVRNAVVTGANRGLGLEICKQMGATGGFSCIYALCRKSSPELNALANDEKTKVSVVEGVDMLEFNFGSSLDAHLAQKDGTVTPISLLVHNAGAYGPSEGFADPDEVYNSQTLDNITPERLNYAFQLNSAAPLFLTKHLLPNLRAATDSKVVIISSLMGSITDNGSGGHYAYRAAKAAVNMC